MVYDFIFYSQKMYIIIKRRLFWTTPKCGGYLLLLSVILSSNNVLNLNFLINLQQSQIKIYSITENIYNKQILIIKMSKCIYENMKNH